MTTVLVTDAEQRSALAVVRSLGRRGHRVIASSADAKPLAGASRYVTKVVRTASPLHAPLVFAEDVLALSARCDVVIPVTDASMSALLPIRCSFERAVLPGPSAEMFFAVSDKHSLLETAPRYGLRVPHQVRLEEARDLDRVRDGLEFPVVIKPHRSVTGGTDGRHRFGVRYADSYRALDEAIAAYPHVAFPLMVQQRIDGPGVGIFLLLWQGRCVAHFGHRRLREKPPTGGVSVYRDSIPVDPKLLQSSVEMMLGYEWEGVCMVELKISHETGEAFLMEVNGRFWGSLQLAIDAGVDFPALLVDLARGKTVEPVRSYRAGVRSRWCLGMLDNVLIRMRSTPEHGRTNMLERLAAVTDLIPRWGDKLEVCRARDPRPFARELVNYIRDLV